MANQYYGTFITYKKVSGWSTGPCKPTIQKATGASNIANMASTVVAATSNLQPGESIQIVITAKEVTT